MTVFLDFGSATETATKDDQRLFDEDGNNHLTLLKGARRGYAPMDLGYANNNDRAAQITAIVDQIRADYMSANNTPYNINFVTQRPAQGDFSTVTVVAGAYPNFRANVGPFTATFDHAAGRGTINGGDFDGFYIRLSDGQLFRPNDVAVPNVKLGDATRLTPTRVLGESQRVDLRNRVANDQAWAFVGSHIVGGNNLTSDQRRTELANTLSHELGHLFGLAHEDGTAASLMNGNYNGTNKAFTTRSHRVLAGVLAPKMPVEPRRRDAKMGDSDAHGSGKGPAPDAGASLDEQATYAFKSFRSVLATPAADDVILPYDEVYATDPADGLYTDQLLPNGTIAEFPLTLDQAGLELPLYSAWIEMETMNIADTLGGLNDMKMFVDGLEVPGAFDGFDQRGTPDDPAGYAHSGSIRFFLDDYFDPATLNFMLADSTLNVSLQVNGESSGVSIDHVILSIVDAPEPGTVMLLAVGALVAGRRRRSVCDPSR